MPTMRPIPAKESFLDLTFPIHGIDRQGSFEKQRRGTTPVGINVRSMDTTTRRIRGGMRPGLSRFFSADQLGSVEDMVLLVGSGYTSPSGNTADSASGRVVDLVIARSGTIRSGYLGGTGAIAATNASSTTPAIYADGTILGSQVRSTVLNQKVWYCDGVNYRYFDPTVNTVYDWTATAGSLPIGTTNARARLICTWRGRIVLAGISTDPQNWFMSRVSTPTDFDYGALPFTVDQAVAGNNGPLGLVGDVVRGLVPYSDDLLIFLCDHSIYQLSGDPLAGGQLDLISDAIGGAWGNAWCKGPDGTLYFMSNRAKVCRMVPGKSAPETISGPVDDLLADIDLTVSLVRMMWNDESNGFHLFATSGESNTTLSFFWEQLTGAWWKDTMPSGRAVLSCAVYDGNGADDRVCVVGLQNSNLHYFDSAASTDNSTTISSEVWLGPLTQEMSFDTFTLKDIQAILASTSGTVTWAVHVGATAEAALASTAVDTGTWTANRSLTDPIRKSGHAIYLKLTSTTTWAMELIRARVSSRGKVRARGA